MMFAQPTSNPRTSISHKYLHRQLCFPALARSMTILSVAWLAAAQINPADR